MVNDPFRPQKTQAQLKIRELLEDTPSMVAFSTARSALQKQGLLFLVEVGGVGCPTPPNRNQIVRCILY